MKPGKKVFLIVLAVFVLALCLLAYTQRDNIKILLSAVTEEKKPVEDIELELKENRQQQKQAQKEALVGIDVRELTEKEKTAIQSGEMSQEEAVAHITGTESNSVTPLSVASEGKSESTRDYDAELAALIGQIYVLEASFTGSVSGLLDSAIAEYKSLPEELHTDSKKWEIGLRYLGVASAMESSCDSQMAGILSQIEEVLVSSGKDTSLVNEIKSAYQSEKALTKEYYLSLYS